MTFRKFSLAENPAPFFLFSFSRVARVFYVNVEGKLDYKVEVERWKWRNLIGLVSMRKYRSQSSFFFFFFCHLPFWMDEDRNGLKRLLKLTFVAVNGILKRLLLSRMVVNSVAVLIFFLLAIDMYVSLLYLPWQRFNVSGWRLLYVFFYFIHLKMQINEKSFDVTNPRLL